MKTYDLSKVDEKDVISFKSDERTMEKGVEWALPHLFNQHISAKEYEHWFFQKHPESWRGWYIIGVQKNKYKVEGDAIVPIGAEE